MHFIALQATYSFYQIALLFNETLVEHLSYDKKLATRDLIPSLDDLLKRHNLALNDINGIIINQGPGPFTSLRVIITTANALNFATKIPLIGVDCLTTLIDNYRATTPICIAMLNAFNNDVYYALQSHGLRNEEGCKNSEMFINALMLAYPTESITFIGNGSLMHKELILEKFGSRAIIDENAQEASLETIAAAGLDLFTKGQTTQQLAPIYLKELAYKPIKV